MYRFLYLVSKCLSLLPKRCLNPLGWVLTVIAFDLLRFKRRLTIQNVQTALGDRKSKVEITRIARKSFHNFALIFIEFLRSKRVNIAEDIEILGMQHLEDALAKKQGAYVMCFHLGNWEAMASKINREIAPSHVIVKQVANQGANRFVNDIRIHNNFRWIERKKGSRGHAIRRIRDVLKNKEIVGFIVDQARPGEPKLPFFGKPAKTNTSLAAIWRHYPAPIVPGFIRRLSPGKHVIEFLPEIHMQNSNEPKEDIIKNSVMMNQVVEGVISRYPEQYLWMHNRWKD